MKRLQENSVFNSPLVALDFETTGLHPEKGDRVIEAAIVRREPDGSRVQWSSLVNPHRDIPPKSSRIHGITDDEVSRAPSFETVLPRLLDLVKDAVLIGHNISFDLRCLHAELDRLNMAVPDLGPNVDTLTMARNWFGWPHCNLKAVSERLDIPVVSSHRALYDAECTLTCFLKMISLQNFIDDVTPQKINAALDLYQPNGKKRKEMRKVLSMAAETGDVVTIDYISGNPKRPLTSTRSIQVKTVHLNTIQAFCHLRDDERFFSLKRIQHVELSE